MAEVSRRTFLKQISAAAVVGGAASATSLPLVSGATGAAAAGTRGGGARRAGGSAAALSEPLMAHIKDLSTGEITVFRGDQEFTHHDPELAARISRAAGR